MVQSVKHPPARLSEVLRLEDSRRRCERYDKPRDVPPSQTTQSRISFVILGKNDHNDSASLLTESGLQREILKYDTHGCMASSVYFQFLTRCVGLRINNSHLAREPNLTISIPEGPRDRTGLALLVELVLPSPSVSSGEDTTTLSSYRSLLSSTPSRPEPGNIGGRIIG